MAQSNAKNATEAKPEVTRNDIYTPRVDIYETDDEVVLLCDMPGVKPPDLDVRFEQGELSLHGMVAPRQAPGRYSALEYGVGDFYRSFAVGPEINAEKIAAECKDGVLTVRLPKQSKAKAKRIAVQAG